MVEHESFEAILSRMLGRVPDSIDRRPGSIIYDALAPAAAELAQMYIELESNQNLSFADTATGEFLDRRTQEFGIQREAATTSKRKGLFFASGSIPLDVPIGTRFSLNEVNYTVIGKISSAEWMLECETAGTLGNRDYGTLLPVDYVEGLARAELSELLVPGEDAETDEALRQRYLEYVNEQPFGGNVADYKQKLNAIDGVGGVKIFPAWDGGGTVKATIITTDYAPPSAALIAEVQTRIDPEVNGGQGIGLAPIGHRVTITGAGGVAVAVSAVVTLAAGTTIGQVRSDIEASMASYLLQLRQNWAAESALVVRVAQLEARMLTVPGVVDVSKTTLNGSSGNLVLGSEQIPVLGEVVLSE
ncbi:putative phage protein gp47/JayE [Fontibacillus phaseoli]|uniref:Putative phage protein gp47/JayE n=1 Tax=Fontibacillus phaseoli TaxID=1416533 RepID=A0A369BPN7_9BACL|nr:baseplate J/gp47 family protein [Fontibacillus phaseoli]RCX22598.1 putative phage protein gp47/JayE [Fontibacillus phaseoli]